MLLDIDFIPLTEQYIKQHQDLQARRKRDLKKWKKERSKRESRAAAAAAAQAQQQRQAVAQQQANQAAAEALSAQTQQQQSEIKNKTQEKQPPIAASIANGNSQQQSQKTGQHGGSQPTQPPAVVAGVVDPQATTAAESSSGVTGVTGASSKANNNNNTSSSAILGKQSLGLPNKNTAKENGSSASPSSALLGNYSNNSQTANRPSHTTPSNNHSINPIQSTSLPFNENLQIPDKPHIDLEAGKVIPDYLCAAVPPELVGQPLVDPDPHYADKGVSTEKSSFSANKCFSEKNPAIPENCSNLTWFIFYLDICCHRRRENNISIFHALCTLRAWSTQSNSQSYNPNFNNVAVQQSHHDNNFNQLRCYDESKN